MSRFQWFVTGVFAVLVGGLTVLAIFQFQIIQDITELKQDNLAEAIPITFANTPDFSETIASQAATITDLTTRLENLEENQTKKTSPTVSVTTSFQKQVIYLGSTNTTKTSWTDTGLEVILDKADFPTDVKAIFEAGLSILGGEAWARIINKTTGAIITISEVFHGSSTVTWKTSASFELHPGKNTYAVQVKSTSSERANIAGARLVISQ